MSQAVSNLSFLLPLSSSSSSRNSYSRNGVSFFKNKSKRSIIKAESSKDNLDHLQRTNIKPQQSQLSKKTPAVSPVGLWDRFPTARTVQQMMETMERMMEDPFAYSWASPLPSPQSVSAGFGRGRTPWEIKEGENEYKMRFDMPGMTKEDVKVWVEEKMLVVKGEKVFEKMKNSVNGGEIGIGEEEGEEEEEWSAKSYGRYSWRIALPENVEFEKITAEVKDGVLYITIPKATVSAKVLDINVQ